MCKNRYNLLFYILLLCGLIFSYQMSGSNMLQNEASDLYFFKIHCMSVFFLILLHKDKSISKFRHTITELVISFVIFSLFSSSFSSLAYKNIGWHTTSGRRSSASNARKNCHTMLRIIKDAVEMYNANNNNSMDELDLEELEKNNYIRNINCCGKTFSYKGTNLSKGGYVYCLFHGPLDWSEIDEPYKTQIRQSIIEFQKEHGKDFKGEPDKGPEGALLEKQLEQKRLDELKKKNEEINISKKETFANAEKITYAALIQSFLLFIFSFFPIPKAWIKKDSEQNEIIPENQKEPKS